MNTSILVKCVNELKQEKPNLQYVLGILETVIEMGSPIPTGYQTGYSVTKPNATNFTKADETEEIPAAARPGPIGRIA